MTGPAGPTGPDNELLQQLIRDGNFTLKPLDQETSLVEQFATVLAEQGLSARRVRLIFTNGWGVSSGHWPFRRYLVMARLGSHVVYRDRTSQLDIFGFFSPGWNSSDETIRRYLRDKLQQVRKLSAGWRPDLAHTGYHPTRARGQAATGPGPALHHGRILHPGLRPLYGLSSSLAYNSRAMDSIGRGRPI